MKANKIISSAVTVSILLSGVYAATSTKATPSTKTTAAEKSKNIPKVWIDEKELGLRKTDLYTENTVVPNGTNYNKEAPGMSKKFDRAYMNAPPMIPHDISDLGEIDKNNNACLGCHMPDVASSLGATPIPKSHFTSFRPVVTVDAKDNVKFFGNDMMIKKDLEGNLWQGRYNCTQCHAPQTQGKLKVDSKFKKDCSGVKGKAHLNKSFLIDEIEIGVKNAEGL